MAARSHRSRFRWIALAGGLLVLLGVLALIVTSGPFLKSVVLPRIGAALNSDLSAGEVRWRPWSELTLRQVRLTPKGSDPLFSADSVRVRYRLPDLLRGRIAAQEVTVESPVVSVVPNDDGTSNLSRLGSGRPAVADSQSGKPVALDVRNVAIRNGVVRWQGAKQPGAPTAELGGLDVQLDVLAPDTPGRLTLASRIALAAGGTNILSAQASGTFGFRLSDTLAPRELNGNAQAAATAASGLWKDYGQISARLTADSTQSEIRELRLALTNSGQPVGEIQISGPWDPDKQEARISYRVTGIGPAALGIAGAMMGLDLGATRVEAEGRLDVLRRGGELSWQGRFSADPLSIRQGGQATPDLGVLAEVRLRANLENRSALLEKVDLKVQQGGAPVATGALDRPMNLTWGGDARGTPESSYVFKVSQWNLAPWRSWFGPDFPTGIARVDATLGAEREGRLLKFRIVGGVDQLRLSADSAADSGLDFRLDTAGRLEEFNQFHTDHWRASLNRGAEVLASSTGLIQYNVSRGGSSIQWSAEANLPALSRAYPSDGVSLTSGTGTLTARLTLNNGQTNLSVQALVSRVSGVLHGTTLRDSEARVDLTAGIQNARVEIPRLTLALPRTPKAANELLITGNLQWATHRQISGKLSATSAGLDLTPMAELFAAPSESGAAAPAAPSTANASTIGGEPLKWPVGRIEWDSRLDALHLREIAISNWITHAEVTADRIQVAPSQLTLNGAPVSAEADLQLGVPGHVYDLKASAAGVPLRPLASVVSPTDLADLTGTLDAVVDLKGLSPLGSALRKNLAGTAALSATNLNYRIAELKSPLMRLLVTTLASSLRLPSISESPLRAMEARMTAGQGLVAVDSASVSSDAFLAATRGEVRLADRLEDSSVQFPVTVSLPKDDAWTSLPSFLAIKGTLGNPRPDVDALGVARALPQLPGAAGELGARGVEKLGGALDRVLGGKSG
ncbi:MAG: hypothetical protein KIT22_10205, partial [Verrucomicrobiae bacterium]|nr:hypothetical protein [Verrucomicrobiae bacterium]